MEKSHFILSASFVLLVIGLFIAGLGYWDAPSASAVTTTAPATSSSFMNTATATVELADTQEETAVDPDKDTEHKTIPEKEIRNIPTAPAHPEPEARVIRDRLPFRLIIPSIDLNDPVVNVGVNTKGEMDVPSGKTKNVGWYKDGTVPGEVGSAVFDAHVFAAFKRLNELEPGDDVYVLTKESEKLHFRVTDRQVYPLASVPADLLFERHDTRRLNLITCAGTLTKDHSTYDHRLIVYTTLVDD